MLRALWRGLSSRGKAEWSTPDPRLNIPAGISVNGQSHLDIRYSSETVLARLPQSGEALAIEWVLPPGLLVEAHGHCLAIYTSDLVKVGEAFISASVPVVLELKELPLSFGSSASQSVKVSIAASYDVAELTIRHKNFQLMDRGIIGPNSPWKRWNQGDRPITYLLDQPPTALGLKRLVVVFSAIAGPHDFTYNYRAALSGVSSYRLFILDDFGIRGSYYLADHRDRSIYDSVQAFLKYILHELQIDPADVTFAGSSKGGTAALIHGLPMDVGNIIVGAPQSLPGSYLSLSAPEILTFMTGDSGSIGRKWLDETVGEFLSTESPATQVRVLVGDADHHLTAHVKPLEKMLKASGTRVQTVIVQDVNHQDIGRPFSVYLRQSLRVRNNQRSEVLIPYELTWQPGKQRSAMLKVWVPSGEVIAVRAFVGAQLLTTRGFSGEDIYTFAVPRGKSLRVRIYRKCARSRQRRGAFTTEWLRPKPV